MVTRGFLLAILTVGCFAGCSSRQEPSTAGGDGFRPIDAEKAVFWDRQTTETAQLLRDIAGEFNATSGELPVEVERTGTYGDIFRKVTASIQAGALPAMAVAYESMTSEYIPTGAILSLNALMKDPARGFGEGDLEDFFPAVLETNRYTEHGEQYYSFPFCKSVLVLFFNTSVLEAAGITEPPRTWDEFVAHCRRVKEKTGKQGYAVAVDASTVSGLVFSMGGRVVEGRKTKFDEAPAVAAFELLDTLRREETAYQITPGTFDDQVAMVNGEVAFTIRTSSSVQGVRLNMGGNDGWGMAPLPQKNPEKPATVLFGPNVSIFNTSEAHERAAWGFVRHFTQPETNVRWALGTGYLPIRKSAAEHPEMKKYFEEWEYARVPFDSLLFARPEPNIAGWQQVRDLIERAETAVLAGVKTPVDAAAELKRDADAVLARQ